VLKMIERRHKNDLYLALGGMVSGVGHQPFLAGGVVADDGGCAWLVYWKGCSLVVRQRPRNPCNCTHCLL
jgi:hypothetical protein